jgi:hypothetical protein
MNSKELCQGTANDVNHIGIDVIHPDFNGTWSGCPMCRALEVIEDLLSTAALRSELKDAEKDIAYTGPDSDYQVILAARSYLKEIRK